MNAPTGRGEPASGRLRGEPSGGPHSPARFVDENLHISWAMHIAQGERLGQPWSHGRGVQVFASALVVPWVGEHTLWASRCLTVAFGAVTPARDSRARPPPVRRADGARRRALYVLCPMTLFYDRLAWPTP